MEVCTHLGKADVISEWQRGQRLAVGVGQRHRKRGPTSRKRCDPKQRTVEARLLRGRVLDLSLIHPHYGLARCSSHPYLPHLANGRRNMRARPEQATIGVNDKARADGAVFTQVLHGEHGALPY